MKEELYYLPYVSRYVYLISYDSAQYRLSRC